MKNYLQDKYGINFEDDRLNFVLNLCAKTSEGRKAIKNVLSDLPIEIIKSINEQKNIYDVKQNGNTYTATFNYHYDDIKDKISVEGLYITKELPNKDDFYINTFHCSELLNNKTNDLTDSGCDLDYMHSYDYLKVNEEMSIWCNSFGFFLFPEGRIFPRCCIEKDTKRSSDIKIIKPLGFGIKKAIKSLKSKEYYIEYNKGYLRDIPESFLEEVQEKKNQRIEYKKRAYEIVKQYKIDNPNTIRYEDEIKEDDEELINKIISEMKSEDYLKYLQIYKEKAEKITEEIKEIKINTKKQLSKTAIKETNKTEDIQNDENTPTL